ncbi:glycosyltransferase family 2 protein [Lacinutrix sp. Bg11-31]|uniref:glycosyltransferase family 2 protein n=1 Tax=Lacinutrix sp. Bg11-31 TaxID=2057808 RepID=UPI000C317AD0|nr:glycosyltransferase family A protein [Lacinutrix sp. Bg11-31]AUC82061.1 glycosyltransferase family 2 protein [Lacinutrix sp. Bg11-31]
MLILFHKNNTVVKVIDNTTSETIVLAEKEPTKALFLLASKYSNRIIAWSHISNKSNINTKALKSCFTSNNVMVSNGKSTYLGDAIGYVEDSLFINVNRETNFPTWLMHSNCGAIYGEKLLLFKESINSKNSLDYNLNSIAKLGMENGLLCYFSPEIVENNNEDYVDRKATASELFKFVKEHFRARWTVLLFLNLLIFEKRISLIPLIKSLFFKQKTFGNVITSKTDTTKTIVYSSISVLIPTLGRAKYLYDVLKDLAKQTLVPVEVILIEQDDSGITKTELNYIKTEDWPFKINHKLIAQTGACNARNIGLELVTSDYVFMADDDIRFNKDTIDQAVKFMQTHDFKAITLSCLRANETEKHKVPIQWAAFGSGCSIVKTSALKNLKFDMAFEHGFGEDTDFGMQLRNNGVDVIYLPYVQLKHLKAPIGGFRNKHIHDWEKENVEPKPSPTVMLYNLKYKSIQQLKSYKLTLLFKFYKSQAIKNPFKYYSTFKKRWSLSKTWANRLNNLNF